MSKLVKGIDELSPMFGHGYNQGKLDTFEIMKINCKHSQVTFNEDSHCSGYRYCELKGIDCKCSIENCDQLKE